jgi:pyruvate dehydrogenase E2 component (dihydrolipoyllysine-residue acetyltransferase)
VAVAITMPRLSDSMEEGTVVRWLVDVGASVERGQALVEIDTDKATLEYEAEVAGTLLSTLVPEGDDVPIGAVIAWIGEPGETPPEAAAPTTGGVDAAATTEPQPAEAGAAASRTSRASASPIARRLAQDRGVDLAGITGSGPAGLITRDDVLAAAAAGTSTAAAAAPATARGDARLEEPSRLQQVVARRMVEGHAAPDFAVEVDVDMTSCVALRASLAGSDFDPPPTVNDLVVKAAALTLREFPRLNGSYTKGGFELYSRINVGVAVAADDGLVVPTVFDADEKPLAEIARETRELAQKVRDRTITPAELDGGTFTISNLGMLGVRRFFPILNPPQAAIIGVGEVAKRPVVDEGGSVAVAELMSVCVVCDHRIAYGADAARFLARLRELLEHADQLA